ncbi:protocadherin Fat 4-like isoform X2 [Argopecten irradians]|uniref:protocadherin Fat 4-like isoform X2 n=1 Tax=Argopecten irradians TaxID=31199 RepID=UPI00371494EA
MLWSYSGGIKRQKINLISFLLLGFIIQTCKGASPVWATPSTTTSIPISENEAVGTSVYQLTATDADTGDVVTYSLLTGSGFTVTGDVVYTNTAFDFETTQSYALQFSATDTTRNTVTSPTLTVTITDYNDNTPTFSPAIYSKIIPENSASGTSIAALTCTDADNGTNADCNLSIQSGDDTAAKFTISGTTIETTGTPTDYESLSAQNYIYSLVVIATDNPAASAGTALTGTAYVYVTITGTNDNTPSISGTTPSSISVAENSAVGTTVAAIQASDADDGDDGILTYSIIGGNSGAMFGVGTTTGEIYLTQALDYETTTSYSLTVQATDGGTPTDSATAVVTVTVTDVNDNTPVCPSLTYTYSVLETTTSGTTVATLACSDADGPSVIYSITSGNSESCFTISTADLNTACTLDYDTGSQSYTLGIDASDGTTSSSITVYISLTAENDNTPSFAAGPTIPLAESTSIGTVVTTYTATDDDASPHDIVSYAITAVTNSGSSLFAIDTTSGSITLVQLLDYETATSYDIEVTATDGGSSTATGTVTVSVTDVNENSPVCSPSSYTATQSETSSIGATVATLVCTDADTADTVSYAFISGNTGNDFSVSAAGVITLSNALDYDAGTQTYTLLLTASDGTNSATATVAVTVGAENEATPTFASPITTTLQEDDGIGTSVTTYTASDNDASPHNIVSYAISAATNGGTSYFSIDQTSGYIQLAQSLDYESTTDYVLTVVATDGGGLTGTGTVTVSVVDVNDNTPICSPTSHVETVLESAAVSSTVISDLSCSDGDAGTTLTYTMTQNPGNKFAVSVSGSTASLIVNAVLDYETTTFYNLQVTAKDGGSPELSATVTIDVNVADVDEGAPVFTNSGTYAVTLSEDTSVGSTIVTVTATDSVDTGDSISYAFVATNSMFQLDTTAGTILLVTSMDYETATNHQLLVTAYDDTNYVTATVTITVNDVNEVAVFGSTTYTPTFAEDQAVGNTLVQVAATDGDSGTFGTITYSISSGDGASYFTIDSSTGIITSTAVIDYEVNTIFSMIVQAVDGVPALTAQCLVQVSITDVNDNAPTFNPTTYTVTLSEDAAVSTSVTTVSATDADSVSNNNNVFEYSTTSSVPFTVDTTTGEIITNAVLDRETTASYDMVILATDKGTIPLTGTSTVTISLIDVNDNDPSISGTYDTTIDEDIAVNTVVFTITATDPDDGQNSQLSYSINSGNTNTDFKIEVGTGIIQTANALDREITASYTLEVYVVDNGATPRTASVTCTVTIADLNDNTPAWTAAPYMFAVDENVATGTNVGTIAATDADTGVNSAISYNIIGYWSGGSIPVTIDTSTGVVTTSASLDRENVDMYVIWCRVQDSGTPVLSSDTNVTITVNDLNDNDPTFASTTYTATVTENASVGTSITTMAATDADTGVNAVIVYSFDTSTTAGARADFYLTIDSSSGLVEVKTFPIDRETDASFTVVVLAIDTGTTPRTGSTTLTVTVDDENDNDPIFSPTYYNSEVPYTGSCNPTILTLTATDADEGANAQLYYYFTTANNDFTMDSSTGEITRTSTLSSGKRYISYGYAHDGGATQRTSTSTTIRIDAYTPSLVVISFYLGINKTYYETVESAFISQLDSVYQVTYSTASVKRWCIVESSSSLIIVHMYVLQDTTTDSISNVNSDKLFLSAAAAQGFVASDTAGTPSASVTGASWDPYVIQQIPLYDTGTSDSSTPWIETATGIAVTTICVLVGVVCITMATILIVKYCRERSKTADTTTSGKPRAEIVESTDPSNKEPPPYSRQGRRAGLQAVAAASAFKSKPPTNTAFVVEPGGDINAWQKKSDFVVTNREFDGRAVDQGNKLMLLARYMSIPQKQMKDNGSKRQKEIRLKSI